MEVGKLTVTRRHKSGKGAARQLRAQGLVPGVCYGVSPAGRIEPVQIVVDPKALRAALDPVRKQNTVISLSLDDGGKVTQLSALLRDFQIDQIRRELTHVDLQAIDPNKEVVAEVPLEFIGKHKGAIDGGQLHTVLRALSIKAKPANIPTKVEVDISDLGINDNIHVSDLKLPEGVTSLTGLHTAVITCNPPEIDKVDPAAAAAAPEAAAAAAPAKDAKGGAKGGDAKAAPAGKDAKAAPAAKAPAAKGGKK